MTEPVGFAGWANSGLGRLSYKQQCVIRGTPARGDQIVARAADFEGLEFPVRSRGGVVSPPRTQAIGLSTITSLNSILTWDFRAGGAARPIALASEAVLC
jgi:hypothetical protein